MAGALTFSAQGGTSAALITATPVTVKSSAGTVFDVDFVNTGIAAAWVQFFDATSVTLGTTVPKIVKWVPAGGAWQEDFTSVGIAFNTGIMIAATTTSTGSTAPSTGINANIVYE